MADAGTYPTFDPAGFDGSQTLAINVPDAGTAAARYARLNPDGAWQRRHLAEGAVGPDQIGTDPADLPGLADQLGFAYPIASIAAVRALDEGDTKPKYLNVLGYYGLGTKGGGRFYRDDDAGTLDPDTDDDGGSLIVTADGVGYRREGWLFGSFHLTDWGARGPLDGSNDAAIKASNGDAIRAAMTFADAAGAIELWHDPIRYVCSWVRMATDGTISAAWNPEDPDDNAGYAVVFSAPTAARVTLRGQRGSEIQIDTIPKGRGSQCCRGWDIASTGSLTAEIGLIGDQETHDPTDTSFGQMGWDLRGSHNVDLGRASASLFYGDNCYVGPSETGGDNWCTNIGLDNFIGDRARRNNLSVISCIRLRCANGLFTNAGNPLGGASGLSPMNGVDCEPNLNPAYRMEDIVFDAPKTYGNNGTGFAASLNGLLDSGATVGVTCNDHWSYDDGIGCRLESQKGVTGAITFNRPRLVKSRGCAIYARRPDGAYGYAKMRVDFPVIVDCNTGGWGDSVNTSAIAVIRGDTSLTEPQSVGNFAVFGAYIEDTRVTPDTWASGQAYALDKRVISPAIDGRQYHCTNAGTSAPQALVWTPGTSTAAGAIVVPKISTGKQYRATAGAPGTTGATQPAFTSTVGATFTDNGITWTCENLLFDGIVGNTYVDGTCHWTCETLAKINRPFNVNDVDVDLQAVENFEFIDPILIKGCLAAGTLRRGIANIRIEDAYDQMVNSAAGAADMTFSTSFVARTYIDDNWSGDRRLNLGFNRGSKQKWSVRKSTTRKATIYPCEDPGAWTAATALDPFSVRRPVSGLGSWVLWTTGGGIAGLAQAGGASTVTLPSGASATDGAYIGANIKVQAGTGISQIRQVSAYNGTTKIATVTVSWATVPDTTSYVSVQGVTGASEPSWNLTEGATTTDGTLTWTAHATPQINDFGAGVSVYSADRYAEIEFQDLGYSLNRISKIRGRWFVSGSNRPLDTISSTKDLPEDTNLYYTDARAQAAYDALLIATGVVARTGSGAYAARTLQGLAGLFTWTNGNGVSGNPTPVIVDPTLLANLQVSTSLLVGTTTSVGGGITDIEGTGATPLSVGRYGGTTAARLRLLRSRAASVGSHTAVANGDGGFSFEWLFDDGTNNVLAASLNVAPTATVSTGIVPTSAKWSTMNTSGTLVAGLLLDQAQALFAGSGATVKVVTAAGHLILKAYTIGTLPSASANAGEMIYCSDLGGGGGLLVSDGTSWRRAREHGTATVATDAAFTVTPLTSAPDQFHTGTLTADRAVTLATSNVYDGCAFWFTRTGPGAFNLSIGGLVNLATKGWCRVVYSAAATAWKLQAYGTLP